MISVNKVSLEVSHILILIISILLAEVQILCEGVYQC
jgi:hypothetical protein